MKDRRWHVAAEFSATLGSRDDAEQLAARLSYLLEGVADGQEWPRALACMSRVEVTREDRP